MKLSRIKPAIFAQLTISEGLSSLGRVLSCVQKQHVCMYFKKSKRAGAEEARARTPVPGTLGRGGYAEFILCCGWECGIRPRVRCAASPPLAREGAPSVWLVGVRPATRRKRAPLVPPWVLAARVSRRGRWRARSGDLAIWGPAIWGGIMCSSLAT